MNKKTYGRRMLKDKEVFERKNTIKSSKLVLKITSSTWENASRDRRELNVAKKLGAEVLVMAKGERTGEYEEVFNIPVYRMSTKPLGNHAPAVFNRLFSVFTWAFQAAKFKADVISGHDLIPLFIGWVSTLLVSRKKRPNLVYDSHEFTIYDGKKSWLNRIFTTYLEKFLIKRCSFVLEVNDCIADEVQQIHKLIQRPVVVRNIPEKWNIDDTICKQMRIEIMKHFVSEEVSCLLMYHGVIAPERGIETLIDVLSQNKNICLFILGNGLEEYIDNLKFYANEKKVFNRISFQKAVPHHELWKYVGAADIGMITVRASWKSHYYMLPNKFFENIQAETPVICSDFPAISKLVKKYKVGMVCNPDSSSEINCCIEKLCNNKIFYNSCKQNIKIAKEELCWEKEQLVLENAYRRLL
ncbi:MAG: glycosyltransferase [[Clostridium] symbiosum]